MWSCLCVCVGGMPQCVCACWVNCSAPDRQRFQKYSFRLPYTTNSHTYMWLFPAAFSSQGMWCFCSISCPLIPKLLVWLSKSASTSFVLLIKYLLESQKGQNTDKSSRKRKTYRVLMISEECQILSYSLSELKSMLMGLTDPICVRVCVCWVGCIR